MISIFCKDVGITPLANKDKPDLSTEEKIPLIWKQ